LIPFKVARSGGGSNFLLALFRTRAALTAAGLGFHGLPFVRFAADRGRESFDGDPLVLDFRFRLLARRTVALEAVAVAAVSAPAALLLLAALVFGARFDHFFFILVFVRRIVAALTALLFEPGAILAENAEIVIRELQIIFALDAIAGELRVARHVLVFFEQLRGVAPLAVVLPVAPEIWASLAPAAATAAALSIVDQMPTSLISRSVPPAFPQGRRNAPHAVPLYRSDLRLALHSNGRLRRG
jgi:hypothetical protein